MKMIENWSAICSQDNEYGYFTVWKKYEIENWFIFDDDGNMTNFSNVRKFFK